MDDLPGAHPHLSRIGLYVARIAAAVGVGMFLSPGAPSSSFAPSSSETTHPSTRAPTRPGPSSAAPRTASTTKVPILPGTSPTNLVLFEHEADRLRRTVERSARNGLPPADLAALARALP